MLLALLAPMPAMAVTPTTVKLSAATAGAAYNQSTTFFKSTVYPSTDTFVCNTSASGGYGIGFPAGMGFGTDSSNSTTFDKVYGAPTEAGVFTFEIDAESSVNGAVYAAAYASLTVKAPTIKITGSLNTVTEDVYFNTTNGEPTTPQFTAAESTWSTIDNNGNGAGITLSEIGPLPTGVNFSTTGAVYGDPTQGGKFPFLVVATDRNGFTATKSCTLTVKAPTITITAKLPTMSAGVDYTTATGGTITVKETGGAATTTIASCTVTGLPDGLAQDGSGPWSIAGTPTVGGTYPLVIWATDSTGFFVYKDTTLTVKAADITITDILPTAIVGATYTGSKTPGFKAKDSGNKNATFEYLVTGLPNSLKADENDGEVSGIPAVAGSFTIQVVATEVYSSDNGEGALATRGYGIFSLTVNPPTIKITASSSTATAGSEATVTFTAAETTYTGTLTWTWTESGMLPTGWSFSDGKITGTLSKSAVGSYPITISAADPNGFTVSDNFTLNITASSSLNHALKMTVQRTAVQHIAKQ